MVVVVVGRTLLTRGRMLGSGIVQDELFREQTSGAAATSQCDQPGDSVWTNPSNVASNPPSQSRSIAPGDSHSGLEK